MFEYLLGYDWPGNVRELQQTMEQVFANAVHHPTLFAFHLPEHIRVSKTLERIKNEPAVCHAQVLSAAEESGPSWKEFKTLKEAEYLRHLFDATRGNITEMRRISDLSRARLYQLLNLHGIGLSRHEPD